MPVAVIDIGTNTLLLLIVDEAMHPLADLCRFGRLGKGLDATGRLADDAIAASLEICREYRKVMDDHGVAQPIVIATQASREAKNAAAFLGPAEQILGAPIQVIAGEREAELAALAVARTFPELGAAKTFDTVDGLRVQFESGEVLHVRPSGNAPELRCYVEAATEARAKELLRYGLGVLGAWRA